MKIRTLALFVVVLLVGYAVATYHHASKAEASALNWSQKVSETAAFAKVTSDYQRGFLRSTQNITMEFPEKGGRVGTITLRNVIYHGPLPGFAGLGIARIDHALIFDEVTTKELAKAFGDAPPLTGVTTLSLGGEGTTQITGAPATYKSDDASFAWQGLTGTVRFAKDMSRYSADVTAPGMQFSSKDGSSGEMKGVSLKATQTRLAGSENIYLGPMSLAVETFSVAKNGKPEFDMKNLTMSSDVSAKNPEFVDIVARFAAAEVRSPTFGATNAEYAFSLTHVHAQSLEKLTKAMQEAQQVAKGKDPKAAQMAQAAMLQAATTHGMALLRHEPVFAIERVGFVTKEGETRLSGSARLVGVTDADLQNPLGMIVKVQADATIKIAEAIVGGFMADAPLKALKAQGREPSAEEIAQVTAGSRVAFEEKLAPLVQQGFILRESGILSSKLDFKGGQLTVNGKPFNPMGQAPQ